jgi:hypothetical protein
MTAFELVDTLQRQGFALIPLPEGKLAVRPANRLTDDLRQHIRQYKGEVVALLAQREASPWLCPHCERPATIEDVFPSLDRERMLTMLSCEPCQVVAVTPNAIKEPPTGWVSRVEQ